jgi:primosomal protein N' (replication factor Y)
MVNEAAKYIAEQLKHRFGKRVLGPEFPMVSRMRNLYHKTILLKIERESSVVQAKRILTNIIVHFKGIADFKSVRVRIDVDPV